MGSRGRRRQADVMRWLDPQDCDPPHHVTRPEQVDALAAAFAARGYDTTCPALVGYLLAGRVQLLSGSHRHAAAARADIKLPVVIWRRADVRAAWGRLDLWRQVMRGRP